jgi:intracellular sulfur oxidation DsrE/DsrF family protein
MHYNFARKFRSLRGEQWHMSERNPSPRPRRWFLGHLGTALTGLGATVAATPATARAQSTGGSVWQPTRHDQDDWFDKPSAKHRFVFDAPSPEGFGGALLYANNYFIANQSGYGLQNTDLAIVIVARHNSTPFAFNDAIWAKYGTPISQQIKFTDPKTKQPPASNLYQTTGADLANFGVTLDSLLKRGVQLAVCQMATRAVAGTIARAVGSTANDIYEELTNNLVSNSHMVPAGIVAVNRAQERGYSFVYS